MRGKYGYRAKKGDGWSCGLLIAIAAIVGVYFGVRGHIRSSQLEPFVAHLNEYISISGLEKLPGRAYTIGKVITVDKTKNETDHIYFDLPSDLRASTPEEVGTVIWLEWGSVVSGMYTDGARGYQITCEVTVIDKARAAIVGSRTFRGSSPPDTKKGAGDRIGSRPTKDIVDYITALPRVTASAMLDTPTPTFTSTPARTPTPTRTPRPTPTPTLTLTPTPLPAAVVKSEALNLRAGPGTSYDILTTLQQGDRLAIVARTADSSWLQVVTADGQKGWVSGAPQYVSLKADLEEVPVASETPPIPTPAAVQSTAPPPTAAPVTATPLPTPTESRLGRVTGRVLRDGAPVRGAKVELCLDMAAFIFFGPSPCIEPERFYASATTDSEGRFVFEDVPVGTYEYAIESGGKWYTRGPFGIGSEDIEVREGETTVIEDYDLSTAE